MSEVSCGPGRLRGGDRSAHERALRRGLAAAGDQATAQDLTQETYLRALRSFGTFEPGSNCPAWLLRIQYNLFCTQYRRGRRMPLVWLDEGEADPSLDLPSHEPGPEEQTVRELDREAVRRAIAQLPEDFRMAVTLVDINGLTCAEAATVMDVPRGTILSRSTSSAAGWRRCCCQSLEGCRPMTCEDFRLRLTAFSLGELEQGERQRTRDHLAACDDCASRVLVDRQLTALLRARRSPPLRDAGRRAGRRP